MQTAIPATLMRGGTSKGLYFAADDLPGDVQLRDAVLLAAMGSPDVAQIDGVGGAHPLTSKVAVLSPSSRTDADIDYLFLQVAVDKAEVSAAQNCGNILAGVGPWAIERGLVAPQSPYTFVRIHMVNSGSIAVARVRMQDGQVLYTGDTAISGVPGKAGAITLDFLDIAGATTGALLPTGHVIDEHDGLKVTCVDNGMPVIVVRAQDLGLQGDESPEELEANSRLRERIEALRLAMGSRMNLGDVEQKTVPKISIISPSKNGADIESRTFIPHRVHKSIGVLGAVSVATACLLPGSIAEQDSGLRAPTNGTMPFTVGHPTGDFGVELEFSEGQIVRSALVRTARKLMQGHIYIPRSVWSGNVA